MQARILCTKTGSHLFRQGWNKAVFPSPRPHTAPHRSPILAHKFRAHSTITQSPPSVTTPMASDPSIFSMGPHTLPVDRRTLHGTIRGRFLSAFKDALSASGARTDLGVVLIQGGGPFHVYSTDGELIFKQEAYMHYLFGVNEEDFYGAVDVKTGKSLLFMPRLPDAYAVWMGALKTPQDFKAKYAVDEVYYVDEMSVVLKGLLGASQDKSGPLYTLNGTNSDSGRDVPGASFDGIDQFDVQHGPLHTVLTESRVIKTPEEVAILRYANRIGALGHVAMMHMARPGVFEYQLEATFLHSAYGQGGCRLVGYTPISASGPNGAVLHYGHAGAPNDRQLGPDDMMLVDMGCEYYRYGSDITCSWPVSGRFSPAQALIYNAVLDAHDAVKAAMKPGVFWPDMQTLAYRTILSSLKSGGLLQGDVDDMLKAEIGALFMPHGLGHFLGIDTHDVGGYLPGYPARVTRPGYKSLRTARELKEGMVITVEPGCYFSNALLLPAFENPSQSPYLVKEAILPFMTFGGVRIEDNVLVTGTGSESLTVVPRTIKEIEAVMSGAPWSPQ